MARTIMTTASRARHSYNKRRSCSRSDCAHNSYSAEFGRGGGSVTNVIYKSGTNDFHGSHGNSIATRHSPPFPHRAASPASPQSFDTRTRLDSPSRSYQEKQTLRLRNVQWDASRERCSADEYATYSDDAGIATLQSLGTNPRVDFLIAALGGLRGGTTGVTTLRWAMVRTAILVRQSR